MPRVNDSLRRATKRNNSNGTRKNIRRAIKKLNQLSALESVKATELTVVQRVLKKAIWRYLASDFSKVDIRY